VAGVLKEEVLFPQNLLFLMPPSYVYTWVTTVQFVDYLAYIANDSAYPAVIPDRFVDGIMLSIGSIFWGYAIIGRSQAIIDHRHHNPVAPNLSASFKSSGISRN